MVSLNQMESRGHTVHKSDQGCRWEILIGLAMLCPCEGVLVRESKLCPCLSSFCLRRLSLHGAKNSCFRASSALILNLGFTVKHLSTRSISELGTASRKSCLFEFSLHHSQIVVGGKDCILYRSWERMSSWTWIHFLLIIHGRSKQVMVNTAGNEDSRLCSFETSHRSSLPLNFAMSFIFLITTVIWLAKEVDETKCAKILLEVKKKKMFLLFGITIKGRFSYYQV
jgi:hypothetical protein